MVEFRTNQVNNEDKPLKGLQNKGVVNFDCADCGKLLLVLQLTSIKSDEQVDVLTRVAVFCCDCGGFSYVKQIPGQFHPGAPSDDMRFDVLDIAVHANAINPPEADVFFEAWSK